MWDLNSRFENHEPPSIRIPDVFWLSCIGIYHRTSEAGEESGSHVKGKNAGCVLRNICYACLELHLYNKSLFLSFLFIFLKLGEGGVNLGTSLLNV